MAPRSFYSGEMVSAGTTLPTASRLLFRTLQNHTLEALTVQTAKDKGRLAIVLQFRIDQAESVSDIGPNLALSGVD